MEEQALFSSYSATLLWFTGIGLRIDGSGDEVVKAFHMILW